MENWPVYEKYGNDGGAVMVRALWAREVPP